MIKESNIHVLPNKVVLIKLLEEFIIENCKQEMLTTMSRVMVK